jgi:hypothetical protein
MQKFTEIEGVTDVRRLPRLGKVRLGMKIKSANGGDRPTETKHFVVPPEVAKVYGETPTRLDVMLPVENPSVLFPVAYKAYKSAGLYCTGNGKVAERRDGTGGWASRECPCPMLESKECKRVGVLSIVLPKVSIGGVYQIATSSWNSICDVRSGIDYVRALLKGKAAWVPLVLERVANETSYVDERGQTRKQTHHTLRLYFDGDVNFANRLMQQSKALLLDAKYVLPEADLNPHDDPPDLIEAEDGALKPVEGHAVASRPLATDPPAGAAPAAAPPTATAAPVAPAAPPPAAVAPAVGTAADGKASTATAKKLRQVYSLCKKVGGTNADALFQFILTDYLDCKSSEEVGANKSKDIGEVLVRLLDLSTKDPNTWESGLEALEWDLNETITKRRAATPS